jgi:hypothetical protein
MVEIEDESRNQVTPAMRAGKRKGPVGSIEVAIAHRLSMAGSGPRTFPVMG